MVEEVFVDKKAPCLPACLDRAMLCRVGVLYSCVGSVGKGLFLILSERCLIE